MSIQSIPKMDSPLPSEPTLSPSMTDAPSPFLPGTSIQYAWDSTSLGYIKTCPRLYQLIMIEGWSPKDESVHLRFGSEYHTAIEVYDKRKAQGDEHEDAMQQAILSALISTADWDTDTETKAGKYKNRRTLIQLLIDYFDKFADDSATTFILDNGKPAVELSFKFDLNFGPRGSNQPYILCGHLDRVVHFNNDLYVLDHKTTTTTPSSYYFDGFNPDNQMTLYTFASKVVYHANVKGVIVEAAQIKLEESNEFKRGVTHRTPDQIEEWIGDLEFWLAQAESFATANYWPMNDTSCNKFNGCQFRGVCSRGPHVRKNLLAADFIQKPESERWNPLKPR